MTYGAPSLGRDLRDIVRRLTNLERAGGGAHAMGLLVDVSTPGTAQAPTTSLTFVQMQTGLCVRSSPFVRWDGLVSSSDPASPGFVQLVDGVGNVIGAPVAVPAGASTYVSLGPVAWPSGTWTPGDAVYLSVQALVSAGPGAIGVRTTGLHGFGSL